MRISYNWLKDYVDVKVRPERLAELLTMSGLSVESIQKAASDYIFEIEITSNRPDCLSYIGIAREVAAVTGRRLKVPETERERSEAEPPRRVRSKISIKVEDKKLCPRYTARVIRDVKVGESPSWLKARIEAMGLRTVNNIVDITNFCLFETGEPMHAFDLDKISRNIVEIRKAKKGERIVTIDGLEKLMEISDLVIADKERPIAIAGVMGGLNTEVTASTKNILLEAAYFDPISIRRTSRRLGTPTESSYRFERKVDVENILYSSNRTAQLIADIAGGKICELYDMGKRAEEARTIELRYSRLEEILGITIPAAKVKGISSSLGLNVRSGAKDRIKVTIPHFRYDLENEIDLIEEIARIYGYDRVPETIPDIVEGHTRNTFSMIVDKKLRSVLNSLGVDEIITYSLLGRKLLDAAGIGNRPVIDISNPLSKEQEVMRPGLLMGTLNAMRWNINRKTNDLKLFELGNIYLKETGDKFVEKKNLAIGITGEVYSDWMDSSREVVFFDLKGIVETLLAEVGVTSFSLKETKDSRFSSLGCASVEVNAEFVGIMGEVGRGILDNFDIKQAVYFCEIYLDFILERISLEKKFKEMPRYPSVFRDISIIVGREVKNSDLTDLAKDLGQPILKDIRLIDRYAGKQIPNGKSSLTYRLEYQDLGKTLEDKDVIGVQAKILRALEEKFSAKLR